MSTSDDIKRRLLAAGVNLTRQRQALAELLFRGHDRHLTAEQLFGEALHAGCDVSLATVYNNLKTFCDAGLLREVVVDATRTYYDTNVSRHHHFYAEETRSLSDIEDENLVLTKFPSVPEGMVITDYAVMIRVTKR
jgi:Fur family iron response transcriptional regulator